MLHEEGHHKHKWGEPQVLVINNKISNLPVICNTCNDINKSEQNQGCLHNNILASSRIFYSSKVLFSVEEKEVALLLAFPALFLPSKHYVHMWGAMIS